ncbi:MAG: TM2 domain-containing protein [Desulfosporosinus sp.]|nr:TM2 domain-containing protein [Desulfosporosinus sp.]
MNEVQRNFRREMGMELPEDKTMARTIDLDELMLQRDMTDSQRLLFQSELYKVRKNRTTALFLTLFLGGVGAHRYYMGQIGLGLVYTLFSWTFIPGIIALIELFFIQKRVDCYNEQMAQEIAVKVKALTR